MHQHAILIVNYNSWDYLRTCLASLRAQTLGEFDLFVLDNGSDDPPPDDIRRWPGLRLTVSKENLGFAAGCNLLLEQSKASTWSLLLNPDTSVEPTWFETMVRAGERNPDATFFCSRLLSGDKQRLDGDGDCYHVSGLVWRSGHGGAIPDGVGSDEYREVFSACGAAAMYRTSTILEIGGFDEDFFMYVEDVDLGFRLRLRGERCLLVHDAVVAHAGSVTSGGKRSRLATYYGHRNLVWCYIKNMPLALLVLSFPLHLLMTLVVVIRLGFRGQLATIVSSKYDAFRQFPDVWRKRRLIQASRNVSLLELLAVMRFVPGKF